MRHRLPGKRVIFIRTDAKRSENVRIRSSFRRQRCAQPSAAVRFDGSEVYSIITFPLRDKTVSPSDRRDACVDSRQHRQPNLFRI
jgi:hypothetical protein